MKVFSFVGRRGIAEYRHHYIQHHCIISFVPNSPYYAATMRVRKMPRQCQRASGVAMRQRGRQPSVKSTGTKTGPYGNCNVVRGKSMHNWRNAGVFGGGRYARMQAFHREEYTEGTGSANNQHPLTYSLLSILSSIISRLSPG